MDSIFGQKIINISMDIEDVYGDRDELNGLIIDLVEFCVRNQIKCDLYISGIRLNTFDKNVLGKLNDNSSEMYIGHGYHSNTHSFITIPEMSEKGLDTISYIEEHKFDVKSKKLTNNMGGIMEFNKKLSHNSKSFRCPGLCWTKEYFEYMYSKGMRFTTIDINCRKPFKFMGIYIWPTNEKPLEAYQKVEEVEKDVNRYDAVSLYFHPSKLVYSNFWDKYSVREKNKDIKYRINLIKQILLQLKTKYDLVLANELETYYIQSIKCGYEDISAKIMESMVKKWKWSQLPTNFYSEKLIESLKLKFDTYCELTKKNSDIL